MVLVLSLQSHGTFNAAQPSSWAMINGK